MIDKQKSQERAKLREKIAQEVVQLLNEKEEYYGPAYDLVWEALTVLLKHKRVDLEGEQCYLLTQQDLQRLLTIVRMLDKICRLLYGNLGEESAWRDLIGYAILGEVVEVEAQQLQQQPQQQLLQQPRKEQA